MFKFNCEITLNIPNETIYPLLTHVYMYPQTFTLLLWNYKQRSEHIQYQVLSCLEQVSKDYP